MTKMTESFTLTDGKGFHLTFKNGWTVSVQFGYGNYCSNRDMPGPAGKAEDRIFTSGVAEIAAWKTIDGVKTDFRWYSRDENGEYRADLSKGWVNADDVADFIYKIKGLPA